MTPQELKILGVLAEFTSSVNDCVKLIEAGKIQQGITELKVMVDINARNLKLLGVKLDI